MIILSGIISFILMLLALGFYSFFREQGMFSYSICLVLEVTSIIVCSSFLCNIYLLKETKRKIYEQVVIWSTNFLCISLSLLRYVPQMIRDKDILYYLFVLSIFILFGIFLIADLRDRKGVIRSFFQKSGKKNVLFSIIALALLVLAYEKTTYFMWDSNSMFRAINVSEIDTLFMIHKLTFYNHLSFGYSWLASWLKVIIGDTVLAQAIFGRALLILGAYGFWKLFHLWFAEEKEWILVILTITYSVSPYFLGMVTYSYLDTAAWYILPILTYELSAHRWISTFFIALLFVFTKEPNVITYVFLVIGFYVVDCMRKKKIIHDIKTYSFLSLPAFLFVCAYVVMPKITHLGGFVNTRGYTIDKLKSFLGYNFNWLIAFIAICGLVKMIAIKEDCHYFEMAFPTLFSAVAFIIVSIHMNTAIFHARYIDALVAQLYILEAITIMCLLKKSDILKAGMLVIQCFILMISSFWTIDPVMKKIFRTVNVGNAEIVYGSEMVSDGWIYNRQYNNFGYAVDMALRDVVSEEAEIFFPAEYSNDTWHFDAMGEYHMLSDESDYVLSEYWNTDKQSRMTDEYSGDNISIEIHVISPSYEFKLGNDEAGYFIYADYDGSEIANNIRSQMDVIEEKSFEKNGWIVKRMKFQAKK